MYESREMLYSSEEWCNFLGPHIWGNWQVEVHHKLSEQYNKWIQTEVIWEILKTADIEL